MKTMQWLLLLPVFFMLSCRSGLRLFNKSQYDKAVRAFAKQLRRSPRNEKAHLMLPIAYDSARAVHLGQVRNYRKSNDPMRYEKIRAELMKLQEDYAIIRRFRAASAVVTPKDYSKAISSLVEKAAALHYHLGDSLLRTGIKSDARKAWGEFNQALTNIEDYRDAGALRDSAVIKGHMTIAISVGASPDCCEDAASYFANGIRSSIESDVRKSRFVSFVTADKPSDSQMKIDFSLKLEDFHRSQFQEDRSADVEEIDGTDTSYVTVAAKVYYNSLKVTGRGTLLYTLTRPEGELQRAFDYLPVWERYYQLTFEGDERALTEADEAMRTDDTLDPPDPQTFYENIVWGSLINDACIDLLGRYGKDNFGYGY
ncbi:hypothetical protein F0L74_10335 [Chitinophaga agrisoli]|uniref:Tetratricopeptide repeat protein n=1 Tax=Chitinophaga agrisoli TaxID=2607653 RepID=A0A5B2VXE1_9BACT|nr:hypothetical protein [Chitinophaga agrisoli]KAA2242917.1 hypothetical protein F0L74_10335 [Chitinophaga agrisoli]